MKSWYLVICKPRQEARAQLNLQNQGIEAFYPKLSTEKLVRGRRSVKQTALFPNYLFVCLAAENGNFSAVKNTRGISGFVAYGAQYQRVPNELIAQLKAERLDSHESQMPQAGDRVTVNNESFKNIAAIYKEPDGDMRSILLIQLLNKQIEITVNNQEIDKI
jgi:transcriptional antiterminator RfaH